MLITEFRSLSKAYALLCKNSAAGRHDLGRACCVQCQLHPGAGRGLDSLHDQPWRTRLFCEIRGSTFMRLKKRGLAGCINVLAALPKFFQHGNLVQFRNFWLRLWQMQLSSCADCHRVVWGTTVTSWTSQFVEGLVCESAVGCCGLQQYSLRL